MTVLSLKEKKRLLRESLKKRRKGFLENNKEEADSKIHKRLDDLLKDQSNQSLSFFWPMKEEVNLIPLVKKWHKKGRRLALPYITNDGERLGFRRWQPGLDLEKSELGFYHAPSTATEFSPDVLLVPLLGFDRRGYRIGYGRGFYDRSIQWLKKEKEIYSIGIAYSIQEEENLPIEAFDEKLDAIISEKETLVF